MTRTYELGTIAGLRVTADRTALWGMLILWAVFILAGFALGLSAAEAVIGGLVAVILQYVGELVHQLGHAWAARRTGYPMVGVRLWWLLGISKYPRDEPELPARVHVQRALGGPFFSVVFAIISGVIFLALQNTSGVIWYLALFLFLDNLLVYALGALLPLGFTDGSTLMRWWGKSA
jgi:hypothetical protein